MSTYNGLYATRSGLHGLIFALFLAWEGLLAIELPKPLTEREPALSCRGSTTLHWFGIHVYDIALYTEHAAYTTNSTAVLSLKYNLSIKHKRLQETTLKEWQRMGKGTPEQREKWIRQLDGLWPDIKAGETLSAFFLKGGPTTFYYGDQLLGAVDDPAFGPLFFAIWLDENCRYPRLRDRLLNRDKKEKEEK